MSQLSEEVKTKVMAFAVENKLETPDRMAFLNHWCTSEMPFRRFSGEYWFFSGD
jgi:hypothetical protein